MPSYYGNTAPNLDDLNLDLGGVTAASFDPIPPGDYQMQAFRVDLGHSQAGNLLVQAEYQILGGEYDNRRIFENYNIQHQNPQVVEIALRSIKSWVMACGYSGNERLTAEILKSLEGREFIAKVAIEKDKTGQYGDKNRVRGFKALPGRELAHPQAARAAQQPTAPKQAQATPDQQSRPTPAAVSGKRPWEK